MIVATTVTVWVKPEHTDDFIAAMTDNVVNSRKEPGNLRFDFLRSNEDPNRFTLVEVYRSEADAKAHKDTAHYKRWREAVEGWMARPREGHAHTPVIPSAPEAWRTHD